MAATVEVSSTQSGDDVERAAEMIARGGGYEEEG
jgi:hypothetical protein